MPSRAPPHTYLDQHGDGLLVLLEHVDAGGRVLAQGDGDAAKGQGRDGLGDGHLQGALDGGHEQPAQPGLCLCAALALALGLGDLQVGQAGDGRGDLGWGGVGWGSVSGLVPGRVQAAASDGRDEGARVGILSAEVGRVGSDKAAGRASLVYDDEARRHKQCQGRDGGKGCVRLSVCVCACVSVCVCLVCAYCVCIVCVSV